MLAQEQVDNVHDNLNKKVALDRTLIKMFHNACKADLLVRARELADRMHLHKSLQVFPHASQTIRMVVDQETLRGIN